MNIDVDELRRAGNEEHDRRKACAHQEIGIGALDRAGDELVAHRAAIDEEILMAGLGAMIGRKARPALKPDTFAHGIDPHRVRHEVRPHDAGDARSGIGGRRKIEQAAIVAREGKGDVADARVQGA